MVYTYNLTIQNKFNYVLFKNKLNNQHKLMLFCDNLSIWIFRKFLTKIEFDYVAKFADDSKLLLRTIWTFLTEIRALERIRLVRQSNINYIINKIIIYDWIPRVHKQLTLLTLPNHLEKITNITCNCVGCLVINQQMPKITQMLNHV